MFLYCSDLRKRYKAFISRHPNEKFEFELPDDEWEIGELRAMENHYLGEALSGTKEDSLPELFSGHNAISNLIDIPLMKEKNHVVIEGEVKDLFFFKVKKPESKIFGKECCKMLLEDNNNDQVGAIFFPESLAILKTAFDSQFPDDKIDKGIGIRLSGSVNKFNNESSIIVSDIYGLYKPCPMPEDTLQKKLSLSSISSKKIKEVTTGDIEDDLLNIVGLCEFEEEDDLNFI
jgi:hypothetical protein